MLYTGNQEKSAESKNSNNSNGNIENIGLFGKFNKFVAKKYQQLIKIRKGFPQLKKGMNHIDNSEAKLDYLTEEENPESDKIVVAIPGIDTCTTKSLQPILKELIAEGIHIEEVKGNVVIKLFKEPKINVEEGFKQFIKDLWFLRFKLEGVDSFIRQINEATEKHKKLGNDIVYLGYSFGGSLANKKGIDNDVETVTISVPPTEALTPLKLLGLVFKKKVGDAIQSANGGINILEEFSFTNSNPDRNNPNNRVIDGVFSHLALQNPKIIEATIDAVKSQFNKIMNNKNLN